MLRARYRRILFFWARTLLSITWWDMILTHIGLRALSRHTRAQRYRTYAARFRVLAISLGGVLIKVGQFLSSRVDVLPPEIVEELAGLQDEVPPERFEDIRRVAEIELGMPLSAKFAAFDPLPMAAASLGQVHRATLHPNDVPSSAEAKVVVKVQRPQIEAIIATDLAALRRVGSWIQWYGPIRRRVDIPALLAEFTRTLNEEIDYLAEGRNAETFAANFKNDPGVRVPHVIWTHTTRRVLTLEDVSAIKITDYEAITAAGISRSEVARRLLHTYLKQIFEDGFFHADPHPGNLFVSPKRPSPMGKGSEGDGADSVDWQLTFIDFGMVGRILPATIQGARELLIGVGTQDTARLVKAFQMLGFLLPDADLALIEQASTKMFERFWGKSMGELQKMDIHELTDFAREFRDLLYTLPFQVPQDLIFLGRCVGILSGMCTGLDPNFNVWDELAPYARKIISEEAAASGLTWLSEAGDYLRKLLALPMRTMALLDKAERGELSIHDPILSRQVRDLQLAVRKAAGALVFAGLLLAGVQLYLGGALPLSWMLLAGAAITLLWMLIGR